MQSCQTPAILPISTLTLRPFSPQEIKQFIGLYILQGLSPLPQVKYHKDYVNGNDLCYKIFGKNDEKRHKHFKTFFAVQNPLKVAPPKSTHPNWKIDPFLDWIQTVFISSKPSKSSFNSVSSSKSLLIAAFLSLSINSDYSSLAPLPSFCYPHLLQQCLCYPPLSH
jgi:hypothetical protein